MPFSVLVYGDVRWRLVVGTGVDGHCPAVGSIDEAAADSGSSCGR